MGNYYEGTLKFDFKPDLNAAMIVAFDYVRYLLKGEFDKDEFLKHFIENNLHNLLINGMSKLKTTYGEYARPNFHVIFPIKDEFIEEYFDEDDRIFDANIEDLFNAMIEDGYKTTDELNDVSIISLFDIIMDYLIKLNKGNDVLRRDAYIELEYTICEKNWNSESMVREMIDVFSPLLQNDYIGTIRDEDGYYKVDFFKDNDPKIEHYTFCGDWCTNYFETSSCKKKFCKQLFHIGVAQGRQEVI